MRLDGTYDERIGPYAGRFVKDADPDLIEDLRARGRLLRAEDYEHSYPHCWRCGTPLLYYAKPSWYIATSKLGDRLLAANAEVGWHPEHIRDGRMGDWLRGNVDWALSRERYWGTPLPVWRCESDPGHIHVIGCFDELEELSGVRIEDPHRPYVDDVGFPCPHCTGRMARVPEVIDVWFDSGSMPFAQEHAPFENEERFEQPLPGRLRLRGARPDARLVLLAAGDRRAAVRPEALPRRRLPRPDPRRRRPEDVEVQGQHRRALGRHRPLRRRRLPLVLLHLQAAVGRLPLQLRRGRRVRAPVPAPAVEHLRVPDHLRARARGRADRPRPLGAVAPGRDGRGGHRAPRRLRRDDGRPGDRRRSSTISPTGTCGARAGASGTATARRSRRCRSAW